MTDKKIRFNKSELVTTTGAPTNIDDYVEYFNARYTFAEASIGIDHKGKKYVSLKWK